MNNISRYKYLAGFCLMGILGLPVGCTRSLSVDSALPTVPSLPAATNTPSFSPTPTGSATPTPTDTGTNTSTPTNTATPTNTYTPTPVPVATIVFENWEGPYPSGNMWSQYYGTCSQANFAVNPFTANAALTMCYDSTPGDPRSGTETLEGQITWSADNGQAEISPDSAYAVGSYGNPINISASAPSSISIWLKTDTAGIGFILYIQQQGAGANYYQNNTGSNVVLTIPNANTWTQFTFPLTAGIWSSDPATMDWTHFLDIGTVFQGPTGGAYPQTTHVFMDDFGFVP